MDDPIKDFSVASTLTSGIDHKHLDPISICLESQIAFQCFFLDSLLYNAVPRFNTVFGRLIFHPKNCVIEARETYIKS